jgi:hypothetical protein
MAEVARSEQRAREESIPACSLYVYRPWVRVELERVSMRMGPEKKDERRRAAQPARTAKGEEGGRARDAARLLRTLASRCSECCRFVKLYLTHQLLPPYRPTAPSSPALFPQLPLLAARRSSQAFLGCRQTERSLLINRGELCT